MEFYEKLFQALKKDDIKEFNRCMEKSNCGSLRLGRFPVLSVMYLYNAKRLLHAYEKKFLRHNSWQDIGEPMELSAKFYSVAGKCLRLYLNETVSPAEMLLLLNRDFKLRKLLPKARTTPPVKQRLKSIYYIRWGLQAEFAGNKIVLERRPLTRVEKLQWLTFAVCLLLCVAIVVATPFVVDTFSRFIPNGNGVVTVTRWEQIRFRSEKTYALQNDVTVSESFNIKDMNCTLLGNGHTVTVKGNGVFGTINGELKDIVFETNGSPIAESIAFRSAVDNVTINANVNVETDKPIGFLANDNYGDVTNVTLNLTGSLSVTATVEEGILPSFNCGGIVANHNYTVVGNTTYYPALQNCVVNFTNFTLQGQANANAAFGGIVGKNNARVLNCEATGKVTSDTLDVAGICAENNYLLYQSVNYAAITQQTSSGEWNPIAAGIVVSHSFNGSVEGCVNFGAITALSNAALAANQELAPCTSVAGIAGRSDGVVIGCVNMGNVSAESTNQSHVGGIIADASCSVTNQCVSVGSLTAKGNTCYVGGIWGYSSYYLSGSTIYYGTVEQCIADCEINVTTADNGFAAVGGIVGRAEQLGVTFTNATEPVYISAIIKNCYFTGSLTANDAYVGGIAGIVGEKVYNDSFFSANTYAEGRGASNAFGAAFVVSDKSYKSVDDADTKVASREQITDSAEYKRILQDIYGNIGLYSTTNR